jgi:hypothetical protein
MSGGALVPYKCDGCGKWIEIYALTPDEPTDETKFYCDDCEEAGTKRCFTKLIVLIIVCLLVSCIGLMFGIVGGQ